VTTSPPPVCARIPSCDGITRKHRQKKSNNNPILPFSPDTAKGKPRGRVTGQNILSKGKEIFHWISLYMDGGTFILPTRDDMTKTVNLALTHFKKFRLQIHTGTTEKKLKTEVLHIPKRGTESTTDDTAPIILSDGTRITFNSSLTIYHLLFAL